MIADGSSRAIAFSLAPGQAHELPQAVGLLGPAAGVPWWAVADRGYTGHAFREHIWNLGSRPVILIQRHEAPVACSCWIYHNRNRVEPPLGQAQGVARRRHPLWGDRDFLHGRPVPHWLPRRLKS